MKQASLRYGKIQSRLSRAAFEFVRWLALARIEWRQVGRYYHSRRVPAFTLVLVFMASSFRF